MNRYARIWQVLAIALLIGVSALLPASASDETRITITLQNVGSLSVAWLDSERTFLVNGEEPGVSSSSPARATAEFAIEIRDTRADGERHGYSVAIAATAFTAIGSTTPLAPDQLAVMSVASAPATVSPVGAGQSLSTAVTLLTVEDEAPPVTTTITVTVALTIVAGTMPGAYSGRVTLEVLPLQAQP
ncbi:MAG: hypothetical protein IT334_10120 [Thermomicrobiales bacterium]|nr:hypothetical protein [Thermomicrobiales bacterium]